MFWPLAQRRHLGIPFTSGRLAAHSARTVSRLLCPLEGSGTSSCWGVSCFDDGQLQLLPVLQVVNRWGYDAALPIPLHSADFAGAGAGHVDYTCTLDSVASVRATVLISAYPYLLVSSVVPSLGPLGLV